jgi:signal transduction histidine kinase
MPAQRSASDIRASDTAAAPAWQRLTAGDGGEDGRARRRPPPTVRRVLARFVAANLVVAAMLLAGGAWAGHNAARKESLADARSTTDILAALVIEPKLDGLLAEDPETLAALEAVTDRPLEGADVVRIKIWNGDSEVVYSDDRRLLGNRYPLSEEKRALLDTGGMLAETSSLGKDENEFERVEDERLLEVYRRVTTPGEDPLLLEAYYRYDQVTARQVGIWLTFAPITGTVLLAMLLVQLPLARRLIRQVREGDAERLELHARAADASAEERRRIAGGLHDGVVQDLSAAPLFMTQAVDLLRGRPASEGERHEVAEGLARSTTAVRGSVSSLRSLLIELYPPHLARAGLPAALADLAARVQARGVRTRLDLADDLDLPLEVEALLFRVAQEALLNAAEHARAGTVTLSLHRDRDAVTLEVRDDGAGFDPGTAGDSTGTGHFGLRVLTDLAESAGATLDLATAPGHGTALRLQVPQDGR